MSWIPVSESMPEPGVLVLVYFKNGYGKHRRLRAMHAPRYTIEGSYDDNEADEYCEEKDQYFLREGWYESNEYEEVHWAITDTVTHWMPLPEPPEKTCYMGQVAGCQKKCDPCISAEEKRFKPCPECGNETFWMSGVAISRTAICCRCKETVCFSEGTVFMLAR